jgi:hypothetical protein
MGTRHLIATGSSKDDSVDQPFGPGNPLDNPIRNPTVIGRARSPGHLIGGPGQWLLGRSRSRNRKPRPRLVRRSRGCCRDRNASHAACANPPTRLWTGRARVVHQRYRIHEWSRRHRALRTDACLTPTMLPLGAIERSSGLELRIPHRPVPLHRSAGPNATIVSSRAGAGREKQSAVAAECEAARERHDTARENVLPNSI